MKYRCKDYDSNLSEVIALPKITGTALVLALGNEMECIRSIGDAPPIGSRGHAGVGLTGICFSSGKVELCNDVENDSRADSQACADLGVRSVLVVPIRHSSRVAGVLEALSSEPDAFDWRTIRHIRRLAQAFDPVTLESWAYSPEQQDGLERAASLQNRSGAAVTSSAPEDCGMKFGEAQPDYQERQRAFPALQPIKELPSQECMDPPAVGAREDAAPSFLTLEEEFPGKSRPRRFVGLAIAAFFILFVCFFEFRTHLTSLSALLDFAPRLPRASSRSSAATSRKGLHNGPPSEPAPGSDLSVKKSAPSPRTAMPQSSAGAIAPVQKAEQNAEASWQLALAYLNGIGVQQDERQAAKWLKKAANLGDPRAQAALSDLYLRGIGVQRDYVRAYTWASIAAGQIGGEDERLVSLRQRMSRSDLEDANRRVQTWFNAQRLSR
jgi:TPR repeat protein